MKSERLQVSVAMCTYNGSRYLEEQLLSIFEQTLPPDEIVLLDDCSSDDTVALAEKLLARSGIAYRILVNEKNSGVKYSFQKCILACEKEIIFTADQDDIWKPEKVEVCMKALENNDLILHEFEHIDLQGNVIREKHYAGRFRPRNYFLRRGMHYGCAMAFRRCVLDYALPFPGHLLLHDYWIGILSESLGRFAFIEEPLIQYRIHEQNTSTTNNTFLYKVCYRARTTLWVLARIIGYKLRKNICK